MENLLPIYAIRNELIQAIEDNPILTVVGETGSGKTTQLPQWMLEKYGKIAITQPRRVAAVTVSDRVSEELELKGQKGDLCGYKIRFFDKTTANTRLVFMTDGVLLRLLQSDPVLREFDAVILDEAHERSLETDILFGLMKVIHQKRPDLRIIIMSATLDYEKFSRYFNFCPVLEIPGRHFDVDIHHMRSGNVSEYNYVKKSIETALYIHQTQPLGDILVFLTGQSEIEHAVNAIEDLDYELDYKENLADKEVRGLIALPLYASLDPFDQKLVFKPPKKGYRKIIFSTNIAATSITIPAIKYVVDSGFVKQKEYDSILDMDALIVTRISKAASDQRAGRAGRTMHGTCWRLYATDDYRSMDESTTPEIKRTSLTSTVLVLKKLGIDNVLDFPFMDPPEKSSLLNAGKQLYLLSALSETGKLTEVGDMLSKFPISPSLARALIASAENEFACSKKVATICASLSSEDFFYKTRRQEDVEEAEKIHRKWSHRSGDHLTYLNIMEGYRCAVNISADESRHFCKRNYFRQKALRNALDIEWQLLDLMKKNNIPIRSSDNHKGNFNRHDYKSNEFFEKQAKYDFLGDIDYKAILKAFLVGFYPNLAKRHASLPSFYHYASTFSTTEDTTTRKPNYLALTINPASSLNYEGYVREDVGWVQFHDLQFTQRAMMRVVSKVQLEWTLPDLLERLKNPIEEEALVGNLEKMKELQKILEQKELEKLGNLPKVHSEIRVTSDDLESAKERFLARKKQKKSR